MTTNRPLTTTLNRIKAHSPPESGHEELLIGLGKTEADDEPLTYAKILEIKGLYYALRCLRAEPQHRNRWRLMAVRFAREVQHLTEDERSINALDVAERCANGEATDEERMEAMRSAPTPLPSLSWGGARSAAREAAKAASGAAWDKAAWAAAWAAGVAGAAQVKQINIFLEIVGAE